jgi:diadenosine tetraphosphate (Ap4A) HIT family hydrolase
MNVESIFDGPETLEESNAPWRNPIREDFHVAVFEDRFPVTPGHLLFVPKYNTVDVLMDAFDDAIRWGQQMVERKEWDGFNIGMNYGKAAGQTIMWPHVHLIPRREGDVDRPEGGVRHVIPGKGYYHDPNFR